MLTRRTWLGLLLAGACAGVVVAPIGTARAAETLEVVAA